MRKYTIDINAKFKEKNCTAQEYKAIVYAWLKGQDEFFTTLKRLEQQQLIPAELALKIRKKFNLSIIYDRLAELKLIEPEYTIQFPSSHKVRSIPAPIPPPLFTKERSTSSIAEVRGQMTSEIRRMRKVLKDEE